MSAPDTRGFTVIEVLVAMLILGVGITALVGTHMAVDRIDLAVRAAGKRRLPGVESE